MFRGSREEDLNQIVAICFYNFEVKNRLDVQTDRPVHKVNYCVDMSACDKCTDADPYEDCLQPQTFSGLKDRDALKKMRACRRLTTI